MSRQNHFNYVNSKSLAFVWRVQVHFKLRYFEIKLAHAAYKIYEIKICTDLYRWNQNVLGMVTVLLSTFTYSFGVELQYLTILPGSLISSSCYISDCHQIIESL